MLKRMAQQENYITKRLAKIGQQITSLEDERSSLVRMAQSLGSWQSLLRAGDKLTARNVSKFELLARVAEHLSKPDAYQFGGSDTKAIYNAVLLDLDSESRSIEQSKGPHFDSDGIRKEETVLTKFGKGMNYNTFRSHMARFKAEKRLYYNGRTRRWRITPDERSDKLPDEVGDDIDRS